MANVVIVAGDTGTGKSTSIKNLKPEEKKNIQSTDDYLQVKSLLEIIPVKKPEIKNIIIDDIGFVMTTEYFKRSAETGYNKFVDMGKHMQSIIETAKNIPGDINVAFMFHDDNEYSDKIAMNKKLKLIGQLLEDKYNPLSIVSVCLFTDVSFDKDNKPVYEFITNRTQVKNVTIPAKSPDGMFPNRIPNDLKLVFDKIHEYYNESPTIKKVGEKQMEKVS